MTEVVGRVYLEKGDQRRICSFIMCVVPVGPSSDSRSYCYVANSNWSSQSSPTEPYETPENIRTNPATDQIKAFRARGHRDKTRSLHRALPHRPRLSFSESSRASWNTAARMRSRHLFCRRSFCPDCIRRIISSISAPPNQRNEYRRSA